MIHKFLHWLFSFFGSYWQKCPAPDCPRFIGPHSRVRRHEKIGAHTYRITCGKKH